MFQHLTWDVGVLRFTYPNAASRYQLDSFEYHLGVNRTLQDVSVSAIYHYSPDYSGAGKSHYIETTIAVPLAHHFKLAFHAGHQTFTRNAWYGMPDYSDWRVAVEHDVAGFNVQLAWSDTNVANNESCFFGQAGVAVV
ncbi:MAG: TorF family putative porin [Gammaproteobacteria bacterium]|nr:TorF family putative porin [Gammaproteobacteria bacterium]